MNNTYLFPLDNTIKVTDNGKGMRFYKGSRRGDRFFPISKKDFDNLDQSQYEIYQKINNEYIRIN